MSKITGDACFDRWWAATPERKLELIDGKLVIGTLKGSRRIVWDLLQDYGPALFLPMAAPETWREALAVAFHPGRRPRSPEEWLAWADGQDAPAEAAPAGPHDTDHHHRFYELLKSGLYRYGQATGSGHQLGRDSVTRLGEDGLTPDVMFVSLERLASLFERYLDGPPTIAIEITLPGSEDRDRDLKRRLYERARVPEYWLFEPEGMRATFFRLGRDGRYAPIVVDALDLKRRIPANDDFVYDSVAVPGLRLSLLDLWTMDDTNWNEPWRPFLPFDGPAPERPPRRWYDFRHDGITWDTIPFRPRVALAPVPITFAEFASWCGRAKFESYGGGLKIDGFEGSRRAAGMLLMTFGLVDVVKLAHPREWVMFLDRDRYQDDVRRYSADFLSQATYDSHEYHQGEIHYHGKVPQLPDCSGWGETFEECRQDLTREVEDWVLRRIARREPMTGTE